MSTFLFRCPATGYRVQGLITDNPIDTPAPAERTVYEPLTCTVCGRIHLVDPKTGRVLGEGEKN
jgi:hypothetical protein